MNIVVNWLIIHKQATWTFQCRFPSFPLDCVNILTLFNNVSSDQAHVTWYFQGKKSVLWVDKKLNSCNVCTPKNREIKRSWTLVKRSKQIGKEWISTFKLSEWPGSPISTIALRKAILELAQMSRGYSFVKREFKKTGSYNNHLHYPLESKLMNKINTVYNIDSFFGLPLSSIVWLSCTLAAVCSTPEREKHILFSSEPCGKS